MPFPSELKFSNEADFTARFLVPLLHRLGHSVVVDYHGTREFGKDLVFGEIDRFGHVRYHGLQAKYVPGIGVGDIQSLIDDAKQAFANPFRHPHTGAEERINMFYAVNGGSFSDQAREHFFNSLACPHGGHVRLVDGKGLLNLDRSVALVQSQTMTADISGILLELRHNQLVVECALCPPLMAWKGDNLTLAHQPVERLRLNAVARYLERPFLSAQIENADMEVYWLIGSNINQLLNMLFTIPLSEETQRAQIETVLQQSRELDERAKTLRKKLKAILMEVGPLVAI